MFNNALVRETYARSNQAHANRVRRGLGLFCMILLLASVAFEEIVGGGEVAEAATTGNPPAEAGVIRQVSIDDQAVIVYIKEDGIYTSGFGRGLKRQVAVGDEAPRAGGVFGQFLDVSNATVSSGPLGLGRELRIVFKAVIEGGEVSEGIFLFSQNRGVVAVALPGDGAPDTGGGVFDAFPGRALMSAGGTILFKATVVGGRATEGLFSAARKFPGVQPEVSAVAVQGTLAPTRGRGVFTSFGAYSLSETKLSIPSAPFVLTVDLFGFVANMDGEGAPQGLFVSSLAVVSVLPLRLELRPRALALVGDNAAGLRGVSTYAGFEDVVLTRTEVVFRARLDGGDAAEGIFQIAFAGPVRLDSVRVLQGTEAPIARANVRFARFGRMIGSNNEELVFQAMLEGDGPEQALFSVTLGPLRVVSETLSGDDAAPRTNGGAYGRLGPMAINDEGRVVFQARIRGGNTGEALYSEVAKRTRLVDRIPDRAPVVEPLGELIVDEGTVVEVLVVVEDADADPVSLTLSNAPDFVSFTDNEDGTATLHVAPSFTDAGSYSGLLITAVEEGRDPQLEGSDLFTITVTDVNRAPSLSAVADQVVNEGETVEVAVTASDPDGDGLRLFLTNAPGFVTIADNGDGRGVLRLAPGFQDAGAYMEISVVARDDGSPPLEDRTTFNLVVNNINRAPRLAAIADQVVVENTVLEVPLSATDPDGDPLTFQLSPGLGFMTLVDNGDGTGLIRLAPSPADVGRYVIDVSVRDGGEPPLVDRRTFNLRVRPPNNPPSLAAIGDQVVDVERTTAIMISATDPDGDAIALTLLNAPGFVTLTDNGDGSGLLTISPGGVETGVFAGVTVMATDDGPPNLSASETFSITARPVITSVEFKSLPFRQLVVKGSGFLTDDARIDVNGVTLETVIYRGQQPDGTSARLLGRDKNLLDLVPRGVMVQVTVFSPSRGVRSAAVAFTRP